MKVEYRKYLCDLCNQEIEIGRLQMRVSSGLMATEDRVNEPVVTKDFCLSCRAIIVKFMNYIELGHDISTIKEHQLYTLVIPAYHYSRWS